jgi:hypothetical protein
MQEITDYYGQQSCTAGRAAFITGQNPIRTGHFNSNTYWDWIVNHVFMLYKCQALVAGQLQNFVKYPPCQKAASFNLDAVLRQLDAAQAAKAAVPAKAKEKTEADHGVLVGK